MYTESGGVEGNLLEVVMTSERIFPRNGHFP